MKNNLFILGFPRCGTSFLFNQIVHRTNFTALDEKLENKVKVDFDSKEPNALFKFTGVEPIINEYKKGGVIDGSQIYLTEIEKLKSNIKPNDIVIFIIRDRINAINSLLNLKHSGQETVKKHFFDEELVGSINDFGLPVWLFRDIMSNGFGLISKIQRDFKRHNLISPIVKNPNKTILQEIKYLQKFSEWPWHSYLGTFFYGHRIYEFNKKTGLSNFCIIKFEDFIKNPAGVVSHVGLKFNFDVDISKNVKIDEKTIWGSADRKLQLNNTTKEIIKKIYKEDDAMINLFADNFLHINNQI
jgi:hypothetical protein